MTPNQHAWLAALTGCALLLFGGGVMSAEPADSGQFGDYQLKGFHSDYSHLALEGGDSEAYVYTNPKLDPSRYRRVILERIRLFFKEDVAYKGIDPTELKELADYFHGAIAEALGGDYPLTEEARRMYCGCAARSPT